jgi:putative membrane protein
MRFMAFNQGFYNLFLALGTAIGVVLVVTGKDAGRALVYFGCGCMAGAAAILATGGRRYLRAVVIQGLPPVVAILLLATS